LSAKPKRAAALDYRSADGSPRVVASGSGVTAEKIIKLARQKGVPVTEDPALVECLCRLPLGAEIPPELYLAVAEILSFVYRTEERLGRGGSLSYTRKERHETAD